MSVEIEKAISAEEWERARALIEAGLREEPESHWLLARLSLTYYEQQRYADALTYVERALSLAPNCPLVLWDYAGTLEMLGRPAEALAVYERLVERGVEAVAYGECGEGRAWARGLIADCHYRRAGCLETLGRPDEALRELEAHLDLRGPGCRSIYTLASIKKKLKDQRAA